MTTRRMRGAVPNEGVASSLVIFRGYYALGKKMGPGQGGPPSDKRERHWVLRAAK